MKGQWSFISSYNQTFSKYQMPSFKILSLEMSLHPCSVSQESHIHDFEFLASFAHLEAQSSFECSLWNWLSKLILRNPLGLLKLVLVCWFLSFCAVPDPFRKQNSINKHMNQKSAFIIFPVLSLWDLVWRQAPGKPEARGPLNAPSCSW